MNNKIFNYIVSISSTELFMYRDSGMPITNDLVDKTVNDTLAKIKESPQGPKISDQDCRRIKFQVKNVFNVVVDDELVTLFNPDVVRWFDSKKSQINWEHWEAYKQMLLSQARPIAVIDSNEEVIDAILDFSGDPTTPGNWARKGLVMGNVQSGKTQNYLGLINKAIDSGYKIIILLGGHLVDLRKQTQERVDEGVLGRESRHLIEASTVPTSPTGVGLYGVSNVDTGTTTLSDFGVKISQSLGRSLSGENSSPFIFTIKKNVSVMEALYKWIKEYHHLNPERGIKISPPLLLIDDEADYASINTKHHKEEVTATNESIRKLLSLFKRNTYVGYTATPFANIFIDPDETDYSDQDDIFPSDFMIRMPTPNNYMGQEFYFGNQVIEEGRNSPIVQVYDHEPIYELKSDDVITLLPESLYQAVRAFILVIAIRNIRGENNSHNTMLVNISHLKAHQNKLELFIGEYVKSIKAALVSFSGLGFIEASRDELLHSIKETFHQMFDVSEQYNEVFDQLLDAVGKVKVWAINQSNSRDNKNLDYSLHKEHGLNAIVIGGHKLSRGLTLEGLSISYFARNSKAYDTLMQMCRWYGYRDSYKDLCKVYLPEVSISWYSYISRVINELYFELDLMAKAEGRPKDFGLKVREHPGGMIITAKNKIGAGTSQVRYQDLWGQVERRFRFNSSIETNEHNLKHTSYFLQKLFDKNPHYDHEPTDNNGKPFLFSGVKYSQLIDFIGDIKLPESGVGNIALINHLKKMQSSGLPRVRVALFNQKNIGKSQWENKLKESEYNFIQQRFEFCKKKIVMPKRMMNINDGKVFGHTSLDLSNSDDEKIFLSTKAINEVKNTHGDNLKPVSHHYIASNERDFPGLIIYLFAVGIKNNDDTCQLGHGMMPTVGYSISLPRIERLRGKTQAEIKALIRETKHSYQLNKVQERNDRAFSYTEGIEDD